MNTNDYLNESTIVRKRGRKRTNPYGPKREKSGRPSKSTTEKKQNEPTIVRKRGRKRTNPYGPKREKSGRPVTLPPEKRKSERFVVRNRGRPRQNHEISSSILDNPISEKNLQTPLIPTQYIKPKQQKIKHLFMILTHLVHIKRREVVFQNHIQKI